jgi:TonB family protein
VVSPEPQRETRAPAKPASPGAAAAAMTPVQPAVRANPTPPPSSPATNTPAPAARQERRANAPAAPYQGGIVHARPSPAPVPAVLTSAADSQAPSPPAHGSSGIRWPAVNLRSPWSMALAAVAAVVLAWAGVRMLGHHQPAPLAAGPSATPPAVVTAAPAAVSAPVVPSAPSSRAKPAQAGADSRTAVHEEIPNVPQRARRTIRGHIRVSVRVIVDADGTVSAALVDHPGPSRYFEHLAIEAAKRWTFAPAADEPRRLKAVHFEFSRDGTTGHAVSLR